MLAWTVQPAGTRFDPPARVCIPNMDMPPGQQIEMFYFDRDLGDWVANGTATITEDGTQLCSDPGYGVVKGAWNCCTTPIALKICFGLLKCPDPDPNDCKTGVPVCPICVDVNEPDGKTCDDGDPLTVDDKCKNGVCGSMPQCVDSSGNPLPNGAPCDDGNVCTRDQCTNGTCTGTPDNSIIPPQISPTDCHKQICLNGAITTLVNDFESCSDGNPATTNDHCENGACLGVANPCVDSSGNPLTNGTPCNDGNICTRDQCMNGMCVGTPDNSIVPPQNSPTDYRKEICLNGSVTSPADDTESCSDGNACTIGISVLVVYA
jgi:hypothetical protein